MDKLEVEAKYRVLCDLDYIVKRLEELGFTRIRDWIEKDTYYNHPCRDFKQTDEALRLRVIKHQETVTSYLTYKGPRLREDKVKIRHEIECRVLDHDKVGAVLESLGFNKVLSYSKHRIMYRNGDIIVFIDNVFGLGYYIEVEGAEDKIQNIYEYLKECLEFVRETYLELCLKTNSCRE
ncbi:MAG: class IV adenylate cyclase [Thermoprotei archaeon]